MAFSIRREIAVLAQGERAQDTAIARGDMNENERLIVISPRDPSRSTG